MSLPNHDVRLILWLGVRLCLSQSPVVRALPVPAGALNRVVELAAFTASLAPTDAHGAVGAFNLPVVSTLSGFNGILSHSAILSSNFRTLVIQCTVSPLVYGNILHIHVSDIEQPRAEQDIVVELLHYLHGPARDASHSENGDE